MDEPIYIDLKLLVFSFRKKLIYEFYYHYMTSQWDKENLKVWFMDTDILVIQIKIIYSYKDLVKKKEDIACLENKNRTTGQIITTFAAVRPQTYTVKIQNNE